MKEKIIYLAGGCFWGVEAYFKTIDGVLDTEVGYANGNRDRTFYEIVKITGHAETVKIKFDQEKLSLEKLLEYFYYIVDPFSVNKQGNDIGSQYRTGIYSEDKDDLAFAKNFLEEKQKNEKEKIQIEVEDLKNFVIAEEYHQDYLEKNPNGYCHIDILDKPEI